MTTTKTTRAAIKDKKILIAKAGTIYSMQPTPLHRSWPLWSDLTSPTARGAGKGVKAWKVVGNTEKSRKSHFRLANHTKPHCTSLASHPPLASFFSPSIFLHSTCSIQNAADPYFHLRVFLPLELGKLAHASVKAMPHEGSFIVIRTFSLASLSRSFTAILRTCTIQSM